MQNLVLTVPVREQNVLTAAIQEDTMIIGPVTKVGALIDQEPYLLEALVAFDPGFGKLRNPLFRSTMAKVASLETAAGFAGVDVQSLLKHLRQAVLKDIIRDLHQVQSSTGSVPADELARLKGRFADLVKTVQGGELAAMEQALINEGLPVEEVMGLCDLHVEVFAPALEEHPEVVIPQGHALSVFRDENDKIREICQRMDDLLKEICVPDPADESLPEGQQGLLLDRDRFVQHHKDLLRLGEWLSRVDEHYQRKEHQLFPVLETRGITGPSQVMWGKDDEVRSLVKGLNKAIAALDADTFALQAGKTLKAVEDMIFKEERILFPLVMEHFGEPEWNRVKSGEAGLGYSLTKKPARTGSPEEKATLETASPSSGGEVHAPDGLLDFATGRLSLEEARLLFTHLPVDVSFVNARDEVAFYSENPERIFPRTPSVIGRKVQFCHPPKSMHIVQEILDSFRSGSRKHAEFWLELGGRFIYIQYFAVRNEEGSYLGCLEVSQDLTRLRALTGEKRLL